MAGRLPLKNYEYDATAPFELKFEKEEGADRQKPSIPNKDQEKKNYAVPNSLQGFTHLVYKVLEHLKATKGTSSEDSHHVFSRKQLLYQPEMVP